MSLHPILPIGVGKMADPDFTINLDAEMSARIAAV